MLIVVPSGKDTPINWILNNLERYANLGARFQFSTTNYPRNGPPSFGTMKQLSFAVQCNRWKWLRIVSRL